MLFAENLHLAYGKRDVLHGISLHLQLGNLIGLIGPNGSGKTTLIRCLSGVLALSAGSIKLEGKNLDAFSDQERARKIAVIAQSAQLPPAFTVFECVALGRTPHLSWLGKMGERDIDIVQRAMQLSDINELSDRRISELSGGEQQRVLLARALAQDCPVLLFDEPTAHLDLHHQVSLLGLARKLAHEKNLAVLVATHDLNMASLYADILMLIVDGRIQASGLPHEVLTKERLENAYQVPLQVHPNPQNGNPWVVLEPF
jgi:iron complex transport system ATP-binding protein